MYSTEAIQAFPQFQPYITIYNEKTPMAARTFDAFSQCLSDQFTNMSKEAITRGGHAFNSYKGKGKSKGKGKKGKRKWNYVDDTTHRGHIAEKRPRSISPTPSGILCRHACVKLPRKLTIPQERNPKSSKWQTNQLDPVRTPTSTHGRTPMFTFIATFMDSTYRTLDRYVPK
jgi:hypothetical protein